MVIEVYCTEANIIGGIFYLVYIKLNNYKKQISSLEHLKAFGYPKYSETA